MIKNLESISVRKQKLYDDIHSSPLTVGEKVYVKSGDLEKFQSGSNYNKSCTIVQIIDEDNILVNNDEYKNSSPIKISRTSVIRYIIKVGVNPFAKADHVRTLNYALESILSTLGIIDRDREVVIGGVEVPRVNWNPFVINKEGNKEYYQRPFVWSIEDKQLLIESIYQNIECGRILVRKRGWHEIERIIASGETEVAFNDIVDGKQRLNAVYSFINGEFPDLQGNFYGDLSQHSQNRLLNNQLMAYAELPEESDDELVIEQFLRLNFCGVPQSKEHIEFVKSIKNKL